MNEKKCDNESENGERLVLKVYANFFLFEEAKFKFMKFNFRWKRLAR